jgi:hypothetical protein
MDRLPADVNLRADRILDGRVVGVRLGDVIPGALGDQADLAVDGLGDVFRARHATRRYRADLIARAAARASALVTGRSQTRPRHT